MTSIPENGPQDNNPSQFHVPDEYQQAHREALAAKYAARDYAASTNRSAPPPNQAADGHPSLDDELRAASGAIRFLLIGNPRPLATNEAYGPYTSTINLLYMLFAADGPNAARDQWQLRLRYHDADLTAAVEGGAFRTTDPSHLQCTDFGNAERLVLRHGQNLRYCDPWGCWLVWDGQRWRRDEVLEVERLAKQTVQGIYAEAYETAHEERREKLAKWAIASESDTKIRAMVRQARSQPGVTIRPEAWDTDPWLFNVRNGTLDLRTGILHRHRREDLITQLAPVTYDPDARLDIWENFLEAFWPDPQVRQFLQRAAGYSLTGLGSEEVLFFPFGPTRTGKSTLLRALRAAWGSDYATTADPETWMKTQGATKGPRNDLAELAGKRLVTSLEIEDGAALADWLIKWLFGGDYVKARFLYREAFEFLPTFKLWLAANHRPKTSPADDAVWRRIRQIPCEHQVPAGNEDLRIKETLSDPAIAGPAILAWAVQGCLAWQRQGLQPPRAIADATAAYREEMDPLPQFLADCFVEDAQGRVANPVLWNTYQAWAPRNRHFKKLGRKQLTQALQARGYDELNSGGRFWLRLKLIPWSDGRES